MTSAAWMFDFELLRDALEQPLRARTFDLNGDAGIGRLERLAELFADRKVHCRIENDLAFLPCGLDQGGRDRFGRGSRGARRRCEHRAECNCARALENVASGGMPHRSPHRASARQRAGGSVSQTSLPSLTTLAGAVTMRRLVPSATSTR